MPLESTNKAVFDVAAVAVVVVVVVIPGAVAKSVEHGSYVREIVGSNSWSSQTNDLSN